MSGSPVGWTDLFLGAGGIFTAFLAYLLNRRGQRTAEEQQEAAQVVSSFAAVLEEKERLYARALAEKDGLVEDYRARAQDAREDAKREREFRQHAEHQIVECRHQIEVSRHRGDVYRQHLIDIAKVVRDETVRAAALDGVTDGDLPDPSDLEDEDE